MNKVDLTQNNYFAGVLTTGGKFVFLTDVQGEYRNDPWPGEKLRGYFPEALHEQIDSAISDCNHGKTVRLRNVTTSKGVRFTMILRPYSTKIESITYAGIHLEAWEIADGFCDLTERAMQVITMQMQGLTQVEIARRLNITADAVGKNLARAAEMTSSERHTVALLARHQGLLHEHEKRNLEP